MYDACNRLAGNTYLGGDACVWKYDSNGDRTRIDTSNGRVLETTYDVLDHAGVPPSMEKDDVSR